MSPRTTEQNKVIRAEREQQIRDAALTVFAQKGYGDTRIGDIAKAMGIAKGTIYLYFESKDALFEAVFLRMFDAMTDPLAEVAADPDLLPGDKLVAIARQSLAAMTAETEFLYLMTQAISTPEVGKLLEHDFKTYYDEFMTALAPLFEALGDPQPVAAASLYLAILDGAMLQSLVGATLFDQEQILTQIRERFGW
ncbi:MAG: TetR/AcrR family transcriptional regulator [Anaerolineae bacterium]